MIHHRVDVPGSAAEVLAAMNDPAVVEEWVGRQHASAYEWTTDDAALPHTHLWFSTPLTDVPAPFDRWVGATFDLRDARAWRPSAGDSGGLETELDVHAASGNKDAHLTGVLRILPEDGISVIDLNGSLSIRGLPWLAAKVLHGQAEKAVVAVLMQHVELVQQHLIG